MSLATSAEHIAVCDAISAWAQRARAIDLVHAEIDKPTDQWITLFEDLADLGVWGAALPEDRGGAEALISDVAAMVERCGYELVPGPIVSTVVGALALSTSSDDRAPALVDHIVAGHTPVVVAASAFAGSAATEIDGGLDLGATPGYRDGVAVLVPYGVDGGGQVRWRLVPPGVGSADTDGTSSADGRMSVTRVRLTGLDERDIIDLPDGEFIAAGLSAMAAAYLSGVCRWALDTAVDYAKVRTQFGAPIGSFQAVKHLCADMACRTEQVTAAAWDLARALDEYRDEQGSPAVADQMRVSRLAADVLVADLPVAVTKDCIQVLGGIGFTFEHHAHLYLRTALTSQSSSDHARRQRAELAACGGPGGIRRAFSVDLSDVEDRRDEVRATVARIAALPEGEQRAALVETGYLAPHWPTPHGLGATPALQLMIDAEFDAAGVVRPDLVIGAWAIPTILEHGTDAQRERFVGPTLAGDVVWCQLFSEPEAGSDLASLRTRAARVDGGWKLSGQKIWTSQAHAAHWGICLARNDFDVPKHKGISYFLVDMGSPGIDIRPLRELTGRANFNEVFLDDVFVPDECVVGEINGGWRLARTTLANERVAMGGSSLGKEMEALFTQLGALGRELSDAETATLGTMIADAHIGRVIDARMVTQRLEGHDPGALSGVRKLIGVAHRQSVPDFALELLGTDGVTGPDAFESVLQNRCLSIAGGTTQILRTSVAERILGLPRG